MSVSRVQSPRVWAIASMALGNVLRTRCGGDRKANLEEAISVFHEVLNEFDTEKDRDLWSTAMSSLANAYAERIAGDHSETWQDRSNSNGRPFGDRAVRFS
jgi:hypothetical protein